MLLCSKDALNWSKVTEDIYNLTKDFHFQCSLFGIVHPKMKIESLYTMLNPKKQCFVFNINNNKNTKIIIIIIINVSWALNQHIIMISEGSSNTEDWSNNAKNSSIHLHISKTKGQSLLWPSASANHPHYLIFVIRRARGQPRTLSAGRHAWGMLRQSASQVGDTAHVSSSSVHTHPRLNILYTLIFSYSSSFPIKMLVTDAKKHKIEPDPNFLMTDEVSEALCKHDWHNVRSYLFFNMRKTRTQCAMTLRAEGHFFL